MKIFEFAVKSFLNMAPVMTKFVMVNILTVVLKKYVKYTGRLPLLFVGVTYLIIFRHQITKLSFMAYIIHVFYFPESKP
jgi:hypothetical protein